MNIHVIFTVNQFQCQDKGAHPPSACHCQCPTPWGKAMIYLPSSIYLVTMIVSDVHVDFHAITVCILVISPSQMEVRASDIRVSERVCMSSITIDGYTTVYNELTDEVGIRFVSCFLLSSNHKLAV